jgi:DMSO reductase anchor subunit
VVIERDVRLDDGRTVRAYDTGADAAAAFTTIWLLHAFGATARLGAAAMTSMLVSALALGASTLHLGRPIHAYRALKMWRRSWLSREVLLFSAFAGVAGLYSGALWFGAPGAMPTGAVTVLLGGAGIVASANIYRVPARPAWNSRFTVAQFALTAAVLGPLFSMSVGVGRPAWLVAGAVAAGAGNLLLLATIFLRFVAADGVEMRSTARLLSTALAVPSVVRCALLAAGGIVLPLLGAGPIFTGGAIVLALAGELLGRYLFFVSVVPKHMATPYVAMGSEAA